MSIDCVIIPPLKVSVELAVSGSIFIKYLPSAWRVPPDLTCYLFWSAFSRSTRTISAIAGNNNLCHVTRMSVTCHQMLPRRNAYVACGLITSTVEGSKIFPRVLRFDIRT